MSEYNQRQYQLMLDRIDAFESGHLSLGKFVDDLEGLLNVLEGVDASWKESFLHFWGKLEDVRAFALDQGEDKLNVDTRRGIYDAVAQLKLLTLEKIDSPADRKRSE